VNLQDVRVLVQEDEGDASVRGQRAELQPVTRHAELVAAGEHSPSAPSIALSNGITNINVLGVCFYLTPN
jgi:hypothetical protein